MPRADVTPWLKKGGPNTECADFQDWARSQVEELQPDVTIVASEANPNRGYVADDGSLVTDPDLETQMFADGVERALTDVAASSTRVIYINDPPATTVQGVECLAERHATLKGC